MSALGLLLIAAWLWFCLVMCHVNHGRIALFGPIYIPLCVLVGLLKVAADFLYEGLMGFHKWLANIGREGDA